jgi:hypothetical protein
VTEMALTYQAFGLTIDSDIECPDLSPGKGQPDVTVLKAAVPAHLEAPVMAGVLYDAAPGRFLFRIDGVARYLAEQGNRVTVDAEPGARAEDVQTFLLGPVFTALMQQRGALVLHAGAVLGARGAVLIAGKSGHGKSTLVAALARRGHRVLTDDVAVVSENDRHEWHVQSGPPHLKLWEDALQRLQESTNLRPVRSGMKKYILGIGDGHIASPQPLAAMYVLELHNEDAVESASVGNGARFNMLCAHTRAFRSLTGLGLRQSHFQASTRLAAALPMFVLNRPRSRDSVDTLCDRVEEALA